MIEIGIGEEKAGNRSVSRRIGLWLQLRRAFDLLREIGRSVDQKPAVIIAANGDA